MFTRAWNAVLNHFGVHDARNEPPCCPRPSWVAERDLDGAGGFEFEVGRCARCGTPWMHAYCVASSIGGFETISREEAEKLKALPADEVKAAMRVWADRVG